MEKLPRHDAAAAACRSGSKSKKKIKTTGTPEPYYGKTLFRVCGFDGQDFIPFGSFHRLPIFGTAG